MKRIDRLDPEPRVAGQLLDDGLSPPYLLVHVVEPKASRLGSVPVLDFWFQRVVAPRSQQVDALAAAHPDRTVFGSDVHALSPHRSSSDEAKAEATHRWHLKDIG